MVDCPVGSCESVPSASHWDHFAPGVPHHFKYQGKILSAAVRAIEPFAAKKACAVAATQMSMVQKNIPQNLNE